MSSETGTTVKHRCKTCHDKGSVPCPNCGGKKEFECSSCHGKGHKDSCSKCGSTGKMTCTECHGSGKVEVDCPVCNRGWIDDYEWVTCRRCHGKGITFNTDGSHQQCSECYGRTQVRVPKRKLCDNCHGDYRGFKGKKTCGVCGGSGKETCDRCRGTGKAICKTCDGEGKIKCERCKGKGRVKCPECKKREEKEERIRQEKAAAERERTRSSYQNRARFMVLGVGLGLLGAHYAYARRWFLFLVQLILTGCGVAQYMMPSIGQPVTEFMLPYSMKLNEAGLPWLGFAVQYPIFLAALIWSLMGVFFVRRDGTNHKMNYDPEKLDFIIVAIAQFLLFVYLVKVMGTDQMGTDEMRRSFLMRIGVWTWPIPFLFAKQWKYFFISIVPVLVDGTFAIGITPLKLWNSLLGFYFLWHVWAVIRTRKDL